MTPETVLDIGTKAMYLTALLSAPPLLAALIIGLLVGMFQAATSINEMTLSFIPKLIVLGIAMIVAGPWMLDTLVTYTRQMFENIPSLIG